MIDKFTNLNADNAVLDGLTRFQGFYENVYRDPFVGGNAFVFITKPLLFIDPRKDSNNILPYSDMAYLNMTRDPIFTQYLVDQVMNESDRKIVEMLSYNIDYSSSSFLPIFTNECKNFETHDTTLESEEIFSTKQGFRESLPTFTSNSEAANSISISVNEDSNLSFTKMMTIWVNYIKNITDGTFDANPDMILNGALDYMSSIFYFVLDQDGKTIKYWAKYTGCWPTTIPYSAMRYEKGQKEIPSVTINFNYNIKEDMNPKILEEFNMLSFKILGYENSKLKTGDYYNVINSNYTSVKESPLLSLSEFKKDSQIMNIITAEERDPILVFVPASNKGLNTDKTSDHFELLFSDSGYSSNFIDDILILGDQNFINKNYINDKGTNFLKNTDYYSDWNSSDFWKEETI